MINLKTTLFFFFTYFYGRLIYEAIVQSVTKSYIINDVRESDDDSNMNLKRLIAVCTRQSSEKVPFKHFFSYVFVNASVFPQMFI